MTFLAVERKENIVCFIFETCMREKICFSGAVLIHAARSNDSLREQADFPPKKCSSSVSGDLFPGYRQHLKILFILCAGCMGRLTIPGQGVFIC